MSRESILRGYVKGIERDDVFKLLANWCGLSQVYHVRANIHDDWIKFIVEMGSSSGVQEGDQLCHLKELFLKKGAKDLEIYCWSLHQDKTLKQVRFTEEHQDEGKK